MASKRKMYPHLWLALKEAIAERKENPASSRIHSGVLVLVRQERAVQNATRTAIEKVLAQAEEKAKQWKLPRATLQAAVGYQKDAHVQCTERIAELDDLEETARGADA